MTHTMSGLAIPILQRQIHDEYRATGLALVLDQAAVLGNDVLCDRKPEACSVGATRDHGIENALAQLRRNARTVIFNFRAQHQAVPTLPDRVAPIDSGTKDNASAAANGLHGVTHDVEHGLD